MSSTLLMPKATAVWLVDNTSLSFEQIGAFCKLHPLEVKAIADGDSAQGIKGLDPILTGQLTREMIDEAQKDPKAQLKLADPKVRVPEARRRGPRYTPVSRRQDRPNAILWLLRNHAELKDAQIMRLVGTTKPTIEAIRERTHWNSANLVPSDPVSLGLCSQIELDLEVERASRHLPKPVEEEVPEETLAPTEETTSKAMMAKFLEVEPKKPEPEEEKIDANTVFAKLASLKKDSENAPEEASGDDSGDDSDEASGDDEEK